jgi:cysteine-rich repeat protein
MGEDCDDGNNVNTDGCTNACELARCGDAIVWLGYESCDDGNTNSGDTCSPTCVANTCGNGSREGAEQCDFGGANGAAGSTCTLACTRADLDFDDVLTVDLDTGTRGDQPSNIVARDVNGDGVLDLTTSNRSGDVTVSYGFGDGRFWTPYLRLTGGNDPYNVVVHDVTNDGRPDVLTLNRTENTLAFFRGDGRALGTVSTVAIGGTSPRDLAVANLVGDANLDVAVANEGSNNVVILQGDGSGGFTVARTLSTVVGGGGQGPRAIAVGDVTRDGVLDIVTANTTSEDITVLRGMGGGNFDPSASYTTVVGAGGQDPSDIALADVTSDGLLDVIVATPTSDDAIVLVALGDTNGFLTPIRVPTLSGGKGDSPQAVAVADVTGDGEPDIVTANQSSNDVAIFRGVAGGATFLAGIYLDSDDGLLGSSPTNIAVADVSGDGRPDIVTSNLGREDITVFVSEGGGAFAPAAIYSARIGYDGSNPNGLAIGDVNDDGILDAVVANVGSDDIVVVPGLGGGRFAPSQTSNIAGSIGPAVEDVDLGDLNSDGRPDYVAAASNNSVFVRGIQDASGFFDVGTGPCCLNTMSGVALGNIDPSSMMDTDLDVVLAVSNVSQISRSLNTGSGLAFSSFASYTTGSGVNRVRLRDLNKDGVLDAVSVAIFADAMYVNFGTGTGTFNGAAEYLTRVSTSGQDPRELEVIDVNEDGQLDVITANSSTNDLSLFLGAGGGTLASEPAIIPATVGAGQAAVYSVRAGDVNGDGIVDLVTANRGRDSVSVLIGFGNGNFAAPIEFDMGVGPEGVAVGDWNGDGIDDIATCDNTDDAISVRVGFGAVP